jgi:hypothetical protein
VWYSINQELHASTIDESGAAAMLGQQRDLQGKSTDVKIRDGDPSRQKDIVFIGKHPKNRRIKKLAGSFYIYQ